jgi:sulfoxide reductase heme-binding subunit YedZ
MSVAYARVTWNRQKRIYDTVVAGIVVACVAAFAGCGAWLDPRATAETLIIRALGATAFTLLHVILAIGPLCRLDRRFLPLLYNRRHLGVITFLVALAHGVFSAFQFHAFGDVSILVSLWSSNTRFSSLAHFPFQQLGFLALVILFLLAATSHDFWLKNLTPRVWKTLHCGVYGAWALCVAHVALGAFQAVDASAPGGSRSGVGTTMLAGVCMSRPRWSKPAMIAARPTSTHTSATSVRSTRCRSIARRSYASARSGVAVFKHADGISALSNVCKAPERPARRRPRHRRLHHVSMARVPVPPARRSLAGPRSRIASRRTACASSLGRVLLDVRALPEGTPVTPARAEEPV